VHIQLSIVSRGVVSRVAQYRRLKTGYTGFRFARKNPPIFGFDFQFFKPKCSTENRVYATLVVRMGAWERIGRHRHSAVNHKSLLIGHKVSLAVDDIDMLMLEADSNNLCVLTAADQ
jgi:hypothetical protein